MRSNLFRQPYVLCVFVLLPLAGACTREPAESTAPATAPATPAAPAPSEAMPPQATIAPAPAPPAGTEAASPLSPPAVPLAGVRSTAIATGHVTLTGSYQVDSEVEVTCAPADTALQLTLLAPGGAPRVLLKLDDLAAKGTSGSYKGQVSIIARDSGEAGFRQSGGTVSAKVTVESPTPVTPGAPKRVSGSFHTTYSGEGGKGTVAGRFERCAYKDQDAADRP